MTISHKNGLIQKSDLLKIQLKLTETTVKKTQLNNAIEALTRAPCQHIGIEFNPLFNPSEVMIDSATPDELFISPDSTIQNMAEYQLLERSLEAANLERKSPLAKTFLLSLLVASPTLRISPTLMITI